MPLRRFKYETGSNVDVIRVVFAVLLAGVLVAVSTPVIDTGVAFSSERTVEREAAAIEHAATELVDEEEVPPAGVDGARRTLTLRLPAGSATTRSVERFEIRRVAADRSIIRYRVEGRHARTVHVDAAIVDAARPDAEAIELRGSGERTIVLTLAREGRSDDPVVLLSRR